MGEAEDAGAAGTAGFFADVEHGRRMERYSVEVAMELLAAEFGPDNVKERPVGNPGYDIGVAPPPGYCTSRSRGRCCPIRSFTCPKGSASTRFCRVNCSGW
jgi:hypothetical protein